MKYFQALLDILYNFFGPHRSRFALFSLIALGFITTLGAAFNLRELGTTWVISMLVIGCLAWYILLPSIIFLIDEKDGRVKFRPLKK